MYGVTQYARHIGTASCRVAAEDAGRVPVRNRLQTVVVVAASGDAASSVGQLGQSHRVRRRGTGVLEGEGLSVEIGTGVVPRDHVVQFYADDNELVASVAHFVIDGLLGGDAVIVVATPATRDCVRRGD